MLISQEHVFQTTLYAHEQTCINILRHKCILYGATHLYDVQPNRSHNAFKVKMLQKFNTP